MNLGPLHDASPSRTSEESDQRPGSIIIPDSARKTPQQGHVPAAGLGKSGKDGVRVPLDVKAAPPSCSHSRQEINLAVIFQIPGEKDAPMLQGGM